MSTSERHRYARGAWRTLPKDKDQPYTTTHYSLLNTVVTLPPSFDLRNENNNVYDQGEYNSCVANAISGALRISWVSHSRGRTDLDQQINPSRMMLYYLMRKAENSLPYNVGGRVRDTFDSMVVDFPVPESVWSYPDGPPQGHMVELPANDPIATSEGTTQVFEFDKNSTARKVPLDYPAYKAHFTYVNLTSADDDNTVTRDLGALIKRVKQNLVLGLPVLIGMQEYKRYNGKTESEDYTIADWNMSTAGGSKAVFRPPGPPIDDYDNSIPRDQQGYYEEWTGGHEMLIVGFRDGDGTFPDCFLVRNSWGAQWGDGYWNAEKWNGRDLLGHFWLPYTWIQWPKYIDSLWTVMFTD